MEQQLWNEQGIYPRQSYPDQWYHTMACGEINEVMRFIELDDEMLDTMIDTLMYEVDEEGGPRCSCVNCYLKRPTDLVASYRTREGRARMERTIEVEEEIGFTLVQGQSLRTLMAGKV